MTGPGVGIRRVVILNDGSVARGGATGLALLSLSLLRQRGIDATFITGDRGDNRLFAQLEVPVVALGQERLLDAGMASTVGRGLFNPRTAATVGEWVRRNDRPGTVYHLHGWSQILSPSVFKALEPVQDRLFVTAHDFFLVCPNGAYTLFGRGEVCHVTPLGLACALTSCDRRSYVHKVWRFARQTVQSGLLRYRDAAPHVLAIHEGMRPILERGGVPPGAITALPNPIRPWSTTRIPAETNAEIVFVGRLDEEKGPDLAAAAARRAGVVLRIIGDGPMLARLQRDHPEVIFSGRQPAEAVAALVRSARALVMPSRYPEPYGLVAGEALWSGLPVIAAEQALLASSIVARGAGLSCDPRDEAALAGAMRGLVDDDAAAHAMSVNAFERTRDLGHTPEAWVDQLLGEYHRAVGRSPAEDPSRPPPSRRPSRGA